MTGLFVLQRVNIFGLFKKNRLAEKRIYIVLFLVVTQINDNNSHIEIDLLHTKSTK